MTITTERKYSEKHFIIDIIGDDETSLKEFVADTYKGEFVKTEIDLENKTFSVIVKPFIGSNYKIEFKQLSFKKYSYTEIWEF
tara:strand:- start:423 stop:671 length:249 start_codon:yes stop_codon:yes gene_type:complete